ncbi:MAG: hypothetical protein KAI43_14505 [Candidatus Aureabacteria bacterium]|nr:hypothetical protein [Candidatus Auribacterota bacterium]
MGTGKNNNLEFKCINNGCDEFLCLSIRDIEKDPTVTCRNCGKSYTFNEEFIVKMKKFEKLILAVREAEDILGDTNVAINIKNNEIKVPYRLLLTRLNTHITLNIGNKAISFRFRIEPLNEQKSL